MPIHLLYTKLWKIAKPFWNESEHVINLVVFSCILKGYDDIYKVMNTNYVI